LQRGSEFAPVLFDHPDPACVEHAAVSLLAPHQRIVCGHAIGDVGVRFKDPDGLAETVVLQGPSGIDGERGAVFRPLLHVAFPPQLTSDLQKTVAAKDAQIQELKARLEGSGVAQKLAVSEALSAVEKERDRLANALAESEREKKAASELADALLASEQHKITAAKEKEIHELKGKLEAVELEKKLAVTEAVSVIEKERDELKNGIKQVQLEKQLSEQSLKDKYETQIKDRDDAIERLKDMKARLSTKMVGQTLEQHCETEFNRVRSMAFPRAYFEKDNDARAGSKGDYIFRDADEAGTEIISIMFEMKNESDRTATKSKNEDFLKELDRDRNEKGCEYAILVSLLEPDNELYNTGIVDVFHRYPKMYVIRPQFFMPMITLLRNAATNSLKYKTELALVKAQNVDITQFENQLESRTHSD
jgi:hypothetical protein